MISDGKVEIDKHLKNARKMLGDASQMVEGKDELAELAEVIQSASTSVSFLEDEIKKITPQ